MNDTIAAIATPYGSGGIGVIRISGPKAFGIAAQVFSRNRHTRTAPPEQASHRVFHGYILDDDTRVVDEVLLIPMKGPRSYTAEDVVEIQAHSGTIVLKRILELLLERGARPAEPGEFTKRAFLNQRIDLTQAEAVADIINARSVSALRYATSQNLGALKQEIQGLRDRLIQLLSILEVSIDFPDEEGADEGSSEFLETGGAIVGEVLARCREFIQQHEDACFLKEGIRIAICGKPNVGKSSLMNRLVTREKAIVTEVPGTTRDPIEEGLNLNGIPFVITDTAGIHDTDDLVEIIGIEKAKDHIRKADLVLFLTEPEVTLSERDFKKMVPRDKKTILVVNKTDLLTEGAHLPEPPKALAHLPLMGISALEDSGIDTLKEKIIQLCIQDLNLAHAGVIPNLRHKNALERAAESLVSAGEGIRDNREAETLAIDIKNSIDFLGTITGETASLDILDTIFNNFCIGK